ncbi:restriction endonuclease, SacI family [Roseimaritima sediminicola]|uniref:restriction endonuclease, SacI family n=1 Tax=Roseimaritima sediminicola TaxID=2662066 RepID=UPI001298285B|nr:hypothetical protein [Roseimaritima sediminicola]
MASLALNRKGTRTIGELRESVCEIEARREHTRQAAAALEAERRKAEAERLLQAQLASIADTPEKSIARIDAAIDERTRLAYQRAAEELSLLAKACGRPMAMAKADSIRTAYPTRSALHSVLKEAGF